MGWSSDKSGTKGGPGGKETGMGQGEEEEETDGAETELEDEYPVVVPKSVLDEQAVSSESSGKLPVYVMGRRVQDRYDSSQDIL